MIRFILLVLFLFSFLLFGIPMLIIEWALSKCIKNFNKEASDYRSLRVVQWAFRGLLWITGVEVT
ncbi:MAG: 1-acyl-sn-glycerol-3-phosphate acyltransferase, partial [Dorea sp.]|nr:1-acyl-sn-glycerol-3-phosphate acyltransferase [Dorea sp.]